MFETEVDFDLTSSRTSTAFLLQWHHHAPCRRRPEFPSLVVPRLGRAGLLLPLAEGKTHIGPYFVTNTLEKTDVAGEPRGN